MRTSAPRSLFKYMSDTRTEFFESPQFLFRYPEQFNDFFDCAPQIKGVYSLEYIKNFLCGSVLLRGKIHPPSIQSSGSKKKCSSFDAELESRFIESFNNPQELGIEIINFLDTPKGHKEFFEIDKYKSLPRIIDAINAQLKKQFLAIFCLTEDVTNKVMWAQYANNNIGFALEVSTDDKLFHGMEDRKNSIGFLKKIIYKSINNARFFTDYLTPAGELRYHALLRDAIFTKQTIWSFEKEWRIALITEGLLPSNNIARCAEGLLISVSPSLVKGVYLGLRASSCVRARAIKFCIKYGIPLFQMIPTSDQEIIAEHVVI